MLKEMSPGQYRATFNAPAEAGQYQLTVTATSSGALPFARQRDLLLDVRPNDVQLAGPASTQALDLNANGLYNLLRVSVPVTVNRAAPYVAQVVLRAADGTAITTAQVEVEWSTGAQSLVVDIDGHAIASAGVDGPYLIDLEAVSQDEVERVLDEKPLTQTLAYHAHEFEGYQAGSLYLPLVSR